MPKGIISSLLIAFILGVAGPAAAQSSSGATSAASASAASETSSASSRTTASAKSSQASTTSATGIAPGAFDAADAPPANKKKEKKGFLEAIAPILILLAVIVIVFVRLPKVKDVNHAKEFVRRRVLNWLPLGITYALFYMSRYNLKVSKNAFEEIAVPTGGATPDFLMSNADFGIIFMVGTITYGCSFIINGPMTDRIGGKLAMLIGTAGTTVANILMGLMTYSVLNHGPGYAFLIEHFVLLFSILYAVNMYFQSFGAAAIVKVNAPWFHLRERGVFGAIFGILISLGVYLAFDVGTRILEGMGLIWVFFLPAILLFIFFVLDIFMVRNTPGEAGFDDFDTGDATEDGERLPVGAVFKKMMTNPIIVTIALVEFCSGFLRQAIMQWYRTYAKQTDALTGLKADFVYENWGLLLACAGIMGGVFAGVVSDHIFGSRRGPVASILYALMGLAGVALTFFYITPAAGWIVVAMSMFVIGVHGMLSGTASQDFGGKKNVGVAVGIIDGFVYLGTGTMSLLYGMILPEAQFTEDGVPQGPATDPENWSAWPISMIIVAVIGTLLAARLWNARARQTGPNKPAPAVATSSDE